MKYVITLHDGATRVEADSAKDAIIDFIGKCEHTWFESGVVRASMDGEYAIKIRKLYNQ